jgi:hypothetical protein
VYNQSCQIAGMVMKKQSKTKTKTKAKTKRVPVVKVPAAKGKDGKGKSKRWAKPASTSIPPSTMTPPAIQDTRPLPVQSAPQPPSVPLTPVPAPAAQTPLPSPTKTNGQGQPGPAQTATHAQSRPEVEVVMTGRLVQGSTCTWIGDLAESVDDASGVPVCPHCKGRLLTLPPAETVMTGVDAYERGEYTSINPLPRPHPGYRGLVEWMRKQPKCYATIEAAAEEYEADTGMRVDPRR